MNWRTTDRALLSPVRGDLRVRTEPRAWLDPRTEEHARRRAAA
jgi:hypothetical protein